MANYNFVINIIKKEDFGKKRIDTVRISDAKKWLIKLQDKDGRGYSSIRSIRGVIHKGQKALKIQQNQAFTEVLAI